MRYSTTGAFPRPGSDGVGDCASPFKERCVTVPRGLSLEWKGFMFCVFVKGIEPSE
jgi:hypothetical protein